MKAKMISFSLLAIFFLACLTATPARGGDAPSLPSIDVRFGTEPEIRKREVTFEVSDVELNTELFAADPKLLEQRYVATIAFRNSGSQQIVNNHSLLSEDLQLLLSSAMSRYYPFANSERADPAELLKRLMETVPEQKKPPQEAVSLLLDTEYHFRIGTFFRKQSFGRSARDMNMEFQILGPSVEMTKAMSLALLDLYDYGVSLPIQQHFIEQMQQHKAKLPALLEKYKAELAKVEPLAKRVNEFEIIGDDAIADLITQRRLISVDIAGAQARVNAAAEILKRNDIRAQRSHVESIKITAEIELVGLTARRDAISAIIDNGEERREWYGKYKTQNSIAGNAGRDLRREIATIETLESARLQNLPFNIVDNKILIQPIKWESASRSR